MPRLNEIEITNAILMMLYGAPGVGKTHFLGSMGSRTLILTDLNGMATLKNPVFRKQYPDCNPFVEVINQDKNPSLATAYDAMTNIINSYLENKLDEFDNIAIDDVDFLRASAMNKAVTINFNEGRSKTKTKIKDFHIILPTQADFGTEMGLVEGFISNLASVCRIFKKNLLVCAHEKIIYEKDKKTKDEYPVKYIPHFTGKAAPEALSNDFDLVFRMTRLGKFPSVIYKFQCHPDEKIAAKDRYSVFKTMEDNLNWPKVVSRVKANIPPAETSADSNEEEED
jgi:hypothetical protein